VDNFSALGQVNIRDLPREAFNVIRRVVRQHRNCEVLAWETKHLRTIARIDATVGHHGKSAIFFDKQA
jgi:hypothetical protein